MSISDKAGDNAGEASMDEILASIRKIIADDPSAPRAGLDARSANPLFDKAAPSMRASEIIEGGRPLLPPGPRFDDALRSGPDPRPVSPPLRGRPFADQALAELLDDGPAQHQPPQPPQPASNGVSASDKLAPPAAAGDLQQSASARPALPAFGAPDPWAAWRNLRAAAAPGSPPAPTPVPAPALTIPTAPSHTAMPQFVNQNLATASVVPQSVVPQSVVPQSGASPPLATPDLASPNPLNSNAAGPQSAYNGIAAGNTPLTVTEPAQPAPLVADTPPLTDRAKLPPVKTTMPPVKPGFYPPTSAATSRRQPASFVSAFPRVTAAAPSGAMGDAAASIVVEPPTMSTVVEPAATRDSTDTAPAPAAPPLSTPIANQLNGTVAVDTPTLAADPTAVAASVALKKLAAGLSAVPSAPIPVSAQADLTTPASVAHAVSASIPAPRTLDDMVSDLLRPMLEKWVESNMPRLMEKALRPGAPKDQGPPKP